MPPNRKAVISTAEQRQFEAVRDAATLQLLFKAARLANQRGLARASAGAPSPPVGAAHTALFPHLDFEGIRLTDLAAKVGVTKQAVGQLGGDLGRPGVGGRVAAPPPKKGQRICFFRRRPAPPLPR